MLDNVLHMYRNAYYAMPQSLKTFLGGLYGSMPLSVRFGKCYDQHLKILREFEGYDDQQQLDFVFNKTQETLVFAEQNIPFYRKRFQQYGVSSGSFKDLSDLAKFPSISKQEIIANIDDLYTDRFEKPAEYFTGGSTSEPTKFYLPFSTSRGKEKAYVNYMFSHMGYRYRDRTVLLKGRETADPAKDIFWDYEPVDNYLCISSNYLQKRYIETILAEVKRFRPGFFFGYSSAVCDFIKACINVGIDSLAGIRSVFLVSEVLHDEQLKMIQEFFGCDVLLQYGHSERCSFAYTINKKRYHFYNSYGLTRSVDSEIVVSSFDNFVMPFINFKTNDYLAGEVVCFDQSDVARSADDIEGRIQEYLVTKDGRLISIVVMGAGHFSNLLDVEAIQYQQDIPGKARLLVQAKPGVNIDKKSLEDELLLHTNDALDFTVEVVDVIEKSSRGKRVLCKQKLDVNQYM